VELYARVRRGVGGGDERRAAAQEFGLARKTVSKMWSIRAPGYQRRSRETAEVGPWQVSSTRFWKTTSNVAQAAAHGKRIFERLWPSMLYGGYRS